MAVKKIKEWLLGMYFETKLAYSREFGFQTVEIPFILRILAGRIKSKNHLVDSLASELNRIWDYIWRWYPWVKELETANTGG